MSVNNSKLFSMFARFLCLKIKCVYSALNHSKPTKMVSDYCRMGGGEARHSISLAMERPPPLSNSLHTICPVPLLLYI